MAYRAPAGKRYRRRKKKGRLILVSLLALGIILGAAFGIHRFVFAGKAPAEPPIAEQTLEPEVSAGAVTMVASSSDLPAKRIGKGVNPEGIDQKTDFWIRVEKSRYTLSLMQGGRVAESFRVGLGKNEGDKTKAGDMRTPEGTFSVERIQDSSAWVHDFGDGKGPISGAYGPTFIRLKTGWSGIGIHGTHDPASIGKKVTEGCIRLKNEDLAELVPYVKSGMKVQIDP